MTSTIAAGLALLVAACGGSAASAGDCPDGQTLCNGACIDTDSDALNCGDCNAPCTLDAPLCEAGACVATCGTGTSECAGACVDRLSDVQNCGRCGNECGIAETCSNGACVPGECRGTLCDAVCVDASADPLNCGGCGTACPLDAPFCVVGECQAACPTGQVACGTDCVDVSTDPNNCGRCNNRCDGACSSGICLCAVDGEMNCGTGCRDVTQDPDRCGSCDNQCADTEYCTNAQCECRPGLIRDGSGNCIDPMSDPSACGSPPVACDGATPLCESGGCVADCGPGLTRCGNSCVDLDTNPVHCGECAGDQPRCENDEVCVAGDCVGFDAPVACNSCPCEACGGGDACCGYPGDASLIVCVGDGQCPQ